MASQSSFVKKPFPENWMQPAIRVLKHVKNEPLSTWELVVVLRVRSRREKRKRPPIFRWRKARQSMVSKVEVAEGRAEI